MNPVVAYILGYLAGIGERGWHEAQDSDPSHGSIVLVNAVGDCIEFSHRFNGGDPQWFLFSRPRRLHDRLDGLYPLRSPA